MQTVLKPKLVKTEGDAPWLNYQFIIGRDQVTGKQLASETSCAAAFSFDLSEQKLPDEAVVVGIELVVDHGANGNPPTYTVIDDSTYVLNLNSNAWLATSAFLPGEYLEITVNGGGTWNGTNWSYPEGSYWSNISTGFPHVESDCAVNTFRPVTSPWFADNSPPFCLVACVRPTGISPSTQLHDSYRLGRYCYLDPFRLGYDVADTSQPGKSGWINGQWYNPNYAERFVQLQSGTLWFAFNDVLGAAGDNTGSFSIRVRRIIPDFPESNVFINCTSVDKLHFPPFNTPNATTQTTVITLDISQSAWIDTGIDVNPGENLSFVVTPYDATQEKNVGYLRYVYPEGYYSDDQVTSHLYDCDQCQTTATGFPVNYAASNCRPLSCLGYLATYDTSSESIYENLIGSGETQVGAGGPDMPGPISPGGGEGSFNYTVTDAMQLSRACCYGVSRMPNHGAGRLLLIFNDLVSNYGVNSGKFNVQITKGSGVQNYLQIGLSTSGGYDPVNNYFKSFVTGYGLRTTVLGNPEDLWSKSSWSANELNNLTKLVARRSIITDECTTDTREIDCLWLIVYWNWRGGPFGMAERQTVKQKINFGKESPHGTAATCTNRAMGFTLLPTPNGEIKSWRPQGNKLAQLQLLMREWSSSSLTGIPTFDEMGYILASVVGIPASSGGGTGMVNTHVFRYDPRFEQDIATYTVEYGTTDSYAHRVTHGFFEGFGFEMDRSKADLTGSFIARQITPGITMTGGVNEVQDLLPTGVPTGGTTILSFKGYPTTALTFSPTMATWAATVQTALNLLPSIGAGGVTVAANGSTSIRVTFSGTGVAGAAQPMIQLTNNSLSGGTASSLAISQFTPGGLTECSLVPILPGMWNVYMSTAYATLASGLLTRCSMSKFEIATRSNPYWFFDTTQGSFGGMVESPSTCKTSIDLQSDSTGMGILAYARATQTIYLRQQAIGPMIGVSSTPYSMTVDMACQVSALGQITNKEGEVVESSYELSSCEDPIWGNAYVITLQNGIASY